MPLECVASVIGCRRPRLARLQQFASPVDLDRRHRFCLSTGRRMLRPSSTFPQSLQFFRVQTAGRCNSFFNCIALKIVQVSDAVFFFSTRDHPKSKDAPTVKKVREGILNQGAGHHLFRLAMGFPPVCMWRSFRTRPQATPPSSCCLASVSLLSDQRLLERLRTTRGVSRSVFDSVFDSVTVLSSPAEAS